MVVLEYDASAYSKARVLPTFSDAPFFYDRTRYKADGAPDLNAGALLADAKTVHSHFNPRVSYYFTEGVSDYHYGEHHPMKPARLALTNRLVHGYGPVSYTHLTLPTKA